MENESCRIAIYAVFFPISRKLHFIIRDMIYWIKRGYSDVYLLYLTDFLRKKKLYYKFDNSIFTTRVIDISPRSF